MIRNTLAIAITASLLAGCAGGMAAKSNAVSGPIESNASYVADASGNVVLSGGSECLINGGFDKEMALLACDPAAAEKAAMEKAAADKAAMEKAAADKAAMEKTAADKAAMEKAAADKAAADKAAMAASQPVVMNLSGKALFASGSTQLSGEGKMAVQKLSEQLAAYSSITSLTVIGHTDSAGSEDLNQVLSEKRATAVRDYIMQSGVTGNAQISVMGMGESQPIASNDSASGRQQNRRVEVEVRGTK